MKFLRKKFAASQKAARAFTLIELLVSITVCSFVFVSLYAGLAQSTTSLQRAREKLRGTQILTEKLEVIRLYNWDQVTNSGFIPTTFTEYQYPSGNTNSRGATYVGTLTIGAAEAPAAYTNTMRKATATVRWTSKGIRNTNQMETLISQYGVQRYVY